MVCVICEKGVFSTTLTPPRVCFEFSVTHMHPGYLIGPLTISPTTTKTPDLALNWRRHLPRVK